MIAVRSELRGRIRITAPVPWGQRVRCKWLPEFLMRCQVASKDASWVSRGEA